jgi:hypothetical protein
MAFVCLLSSVNEVNGQTWNLPDNRPNDRFTSDHFDIPRPALSMRSFDNTKSDNYNHTYSSTTLGVRQVLVRAYGIGQFQEEAVEFVFRNIIDQSKNNLLSFQSTNAEHNSSVLESMAFVSLMSFIIEQNDGDSGEPNIFTEDKKIWFYGKPCG